MPADHGTPNTGDERDREVERLANDLAGDWRERAERAEADVTMWKTRLVEETARLRELLRAARSPQPEDHAQQCAWCDGEGAVRDTGGKLGEDCPRCKGRSRLDVPPSPQGQDHEAGIEAAIEAAMPTARPGTTKGELLMILLPAIPAYLAAATPSRDGTVAVEDVRARIQAIYDRTATGGFSDMYRNGLLAALAEFGASERTERIHDQATKED